ncbi:hypothetical protein C8J56DRAFT_1167343 [Mycena floridula]|nr:hypothetical protein C8J56DRAFT_1167343 [Mycena floridula]
MQRKSHYSMADDPWCSEAHKTLWGKSSETKENGIEVLPPCLIKPFESAPCRLPFIYVRDEFHLAWKHILETKDSPESYGGLVVWGHTGVGLSIFLRYALFRALVAKEPVAFCDDSNVFRYFDAAGGRLMSFTEAEHFPFPPRVLALFDTSYYLPTPKLPFSQLGFVVQAQSLRQAEREPQTWAKDRRVLGWPIRLWADPEMVIVDSLLPEAKPFDTSSISCHPPSPPPEYYTSLEISEYLGPYPQICKRFIEKTGDPDSDFGHQVPDLSFSSIAKFTADPEHSPDADKFHRYFYATRRDSVTRPHIYPSPISELCRYEIPTPFLRRRLLKWFSPAEIAAVLEHSSVQESKNLAVK